MAFRIMDDTMTLEIDNQDVALLSRIDNFVSARNQIHSNEDLSL